MSTYPLPDIDLSGRVVLITGGDRGLGLSMATAQAQCGASVVLASVDYDGCVASAAAISDSVGADRALGLQLDITDLAACRAAIAATIEKFGRLDAVFNNARRLMRGPGLPPGGNSLPLHETDPEIYAETVKVNVVGTFFMARAAAEHFRSVGGGKIVNISTSRRNFSRPHNSPYGVTKAAVESQTIIWAGDLVDENITVNALLPGGAADTDATRPFKEGQLLLPVDIMDPLAVWLASSGSDGATARRYVGKLWDPSLPPGEAADGSREEPTFIEQLPG
ncbi:MAG: NAD(P)-dependent dehydrogenase (short-subunit alcohol dehydrogenase family) [Alphaproteobacteria bacterium]|jgi:NAD(P)-dependent dehydrogenase (short-subunit alcohol dehydrogenase family)